MKELLAILGEFPSFEKKAVAYYSRTHTFVPQFSKARIRISARSQELFFYMALHSVALPGTGTNKSLVVLQKVPAPLILLAGKVECVVLSV